MREALMRRIVLLFSCVLLLFHGFLFHLLPAAQALDGEALLKETQAALDSLDVSRALSLAEKAVAAMPVA